jgi:hypothetical protein
MGTNSNPLIQNTLLSLIVFLKHKAEEKSLKPVITIAKLSDMMRSSGMRITYQQLVDLSKSPAIAPSIKSINKNQIVFNLDTDEVEPQQSEMPMEPIPNEEENPEENPDEMGGDEYNPEDFSGPEEGIENQEMQPPQHQQQSIISAMARRAANRPD